MFFFSNSMGFLYEDRGRSVYRHVGRRFSAPRRSSEIEKAQGDHVEEGQQAQGVVHRQEGKQFH